MKINKEICWIVIFLTPLFLGFFDHRLWVGDNFIISFVIYVYGVFLGYLLFQLIGVYKGITKQIFPKDINNNEYQYKVLPENRCQALKYYPEDTSFTGFIKYHSYFKVFYLTTDGISFTKLEHAYDIKQL